MPESFVASSDPIGRFSQLNRGNEVQVEKNRMLAQSLAAVTLTIVSTLSAQAQAVLNLRDFPGLSEVQRPVAAAVQSACGSLGAKGAARTPDETKLFESCRKMVQTANGLAGNGASANSLNISARLCATRFRP